MAIVDAYVASLDEPRRTKVAAAIAIIRSAGAGAHEGVEWKMPVFRKGDLYVAIANQKNYVSVYCCNDESAAAALKAAGPKGVKGGKCCVNYPDGVDIPAAALATMVKKVLL
jgi:hypothetical protein